MDIEMSDKALNIDSFCDSPIHLKEVDPREIAKNAEKVHLVNRQRLLM
jgi:hypothetical protein